MEMNKKNTITYGLPIIAVLSLLTLYLIPAFTFEWQDKIKHLTLISIWNYGIRWIPAIILVAVIVLSLLKKHTVTFILTIAYSLFVILTAIGSGYKLYIGFYILIIEIVIMVGLSAFQFNKAKRQSTVEEERMDEKIIISGKPNNSIGSIALGGGIVLIGIGLYILCCIGINRGWDYGGGPAIIWGFIISVIALAIIVVGFDLKSSEITVTDKRIYGKASFGKRVDLPIDSVSAVGTSMFHGIAVTTASGAIKFSNIVNSDEIHKAVSDLLIERQNKAPVTATTTIKQEIPQSNADELKKYKELLDSGIITQEEFDAKKKQLLGL